MKKKILIIITIMLLIVTGCGREPISNGRFEKVMKENNFKITERYEELSKNDVNYKSLLSAYNNDTVTITYTIYKETNKPIEEIKGAKRIIKGEVIDSRATFTYASLNIKEDTGLNHIYIAIDKSILHFTFEDKDKEIIKKILKEFAYEDYTKKIS